MDGTQQVAHAPWDLAASPFGWHDTNGIPGAEFTITRGNNVQAQEDRDANNTGGFSPDGGANLDFLATVNLAQEPAIYESASITNAFYWANTAHDILYRYGFTEQFWDFQQNNYGNPGTANDPLILDVQDGAFVNNAKYSPAVDGT